MRKYVALGLLAALFAAAPASAQEVEELELRIDAIDQSDFPAVVLTVTVPPEMNGLELTPENFFVSEDDTGVAVQVTRLPAEELAVALVVDTSGSMEGSPLESAKEAVAGFVDAMPADVELALLGFGDTSELLVPFTTDRDAVLNGVSGLDSGGDTALYDGLVEAAASFGQEEKRRTILLLTDGRDTVSDAELDDALVALIGSDVRLVIVELESPEIDRTTLNRLEGATGGIIVAATDPAALQGIYSDVASDLINQYELSYRSVAEGATTILTAVRTAEASAIGSSSVNFPVPEPVVTVPTTTLASPPPTTRAPIDVVAIPTVVDVPWYATTTGLMVGAAAVFGALTFIFLLLMPTRHRAMDALHSMAELGGRVPQKGRMSQIANKATLFAEDALNRGASDSALRLRLDQAGLHLREGELLLVVFAAVTVAVVGGWLFGGPLLATILGAAVIGIASAILNWLGRRRVNAFRLQLPDTLQLISGSLRAGFGLNQALAAVASEQGAPTNEEFSRAQLEVHLGKDVEDALRNMAVRTRSEDLPWVAEAIEIHREIGGDVADLLDQIAATVRERERVRGQIQVLSAEGKVSGIVLVALPFVIAALTFSVAPDYLGELTGTTTGRLMLAAGVSSMLIGIFWIRRIVTLEF